MESLPGEIFGALAAVTTVGGALPIIWAAKVVQKDAGPELNALALNALTHPGWNLSATEWRQIFVAFMDKWFGQRLFSLRAILRSALATAIVFVFGLAVGFNLMFEYISQSTAFEVHGIGDVLAIAGALAIAATLNVVADFLSIVQMRFLIRRWLPDNQIISLLLPFISLALSALIMGIVFLPVLGVGGEEGRNVWDVFFIVPLTILFIFSSDPYLFTSSASTFVFIAMAITTIWSSLYFFATIYGVYFVRIAVKVLKLFQMFGMIWNSNAPITAVGWSVAIFYWCFLLGSFGLNQIL